ncbi:MAG: hypothetical protein ACRCVA_16170 [Phreatobacter sp.]
MTVMRLLAMSFITMVSVGSEVRAQALDMAAGKPLGELINSGFAISSSTNNGRPGEVVLTVQQGARAFICVVTGARGTNQADPPARLTALPCIPLN